MRRVAQLVLGLFLAAIGIVCTLRSGLGVSPWDVLHGGLADRLHLSFGLVVQGVGAVVLAASLLLGVRPASARSRTSSSSARSRTCCSALDGESGCRSSRASRCSSWASR